MKKSRVVAALVEAQLGADQMAYAAEVLSAQADAYATRIDKRAAKLGLMADLQYELHMRRCSRRRPRWR
jgi:hypothetical protein